MYIYTRDYIDACTVPSSGNSVGDNWNLSVNKVSVTDNETMVDRGRSAMFEEDYVQMEYKEKEN